MGKKIDKEGDYNAALTNETVRTIQQSIKFAKKKARCLSVDQISVLQLVARELKMSF